MNKCKDCRREISWEDAECPHCGCREWQSMPDRISDRGAWLVDWLPIALLAFIVIVILTWLLNW